MRARPTLGALVRTELARCRLRPVVGRLPLLAGGVAAAIAALGQPGRDSLAGPQLTGAIGLAATPGVLVAFAIGASVAHDARTSGTDATDRALVGRPLALGAAQAVAIAAWLAVIAVTVAAAVAATVTASGLVHGHAIDAGEVLGALGPGAARFALAAAATGAVGGAVAKLAGSATAAVGGFLLLLLIGDGALVALHPQLVSAALPDNLLGLGSGELEGLAVRGEATTATAARALLGALAVAVVGVTVDSRRDLL